MTTERYEVSRLIQASPAVIFAVLRTLVTSYYDWSRIEPRYRDVISFPVIEDTTLKATLGILARNGE